MCRLYALFALFVAFLAARHAAAAPTMAERVAAYATKNNLPIRQVPLNVPGRQGVRIVVPVTDASHDDFVNSFTQDGAIIRQQAADSEHVTMALSPNELIHNWGLAGPMFAPSAGGTYVALDLSPEEKAHFNDARDQVRQRRGGKVIAEVNPNVPNVRGNRIPYDSLTHVVAGNDMLAEAIQLVPMATEKAIAQNVAKLLPAGQRPTLQVGIGDALAGVGDALKGRPLDIWSEMGPAGLIKLVTDPDSKVGTATFSFLHADNASYKSASDNPRITLAPSNIVNDPAVIAAKPRMVAINTGLEVDLLGNVNAERDGERVISAPGGQPDFMKGASMAQDGTAILALRSTAKGTLTSVVTALKGPTTTPKDNVDHIVTEWGATARLRGQPDGVRAYEIISVAHPAFRGELADFAQQKGILTPAQTAELKKGVYAAVVAAPEEIREAVANKSLEKGLITNDQHTEIIVQLLTPKVHGG